MAGKTAVKLDITVKLWDKYNLEAKGEYRVALIGLKPKFPEFTYKGSFETDEDDLTEKVILTDFNRAAHGIVTQMAMGIDSNVASYLKKAKVDTKDGKAVVAACNSGAAPLLADTKLECAAASKRMRGLMEAIIKEYAAKREGEGVDFQSEAAVKKYLKTLSGIASLKDDYTTFKTTLAEAAKTIPAKQAGLVGQAWSTLMASEGVHLVETAKKIPKVAEVKPDKKDKKDKDKAAAKQVEAVNEIAQELDWLRQNMGKLEAEIEKLKGGYKTLQSALAGHAPPDAGKDKGPPPKEAQSANAKQAALVQKAIDSFPEIPMKIIDGVIASLRGADKNMAAFKKNAA